MHVFLSHKSPPCLEAPGYGFKTGDSMLLKVWKEQGTDQQMEENGRNYTTSSLLLTHP